MGASRVNAPDSDVRRGHEFVEHELVVEPVVDRCMEKNSALNFTRGLKCIEKSSSRTRSRSDEI